MIYSTCEYGKFEDKANDKIVNYAQNTDFKFREKVEKNQHTQFHSHNIYLFSILISVRIF